MCLLLTEKGPTEGGALEEAGFSLVLGFVVTKDCVLCIVCGSAKRRWTEQPKKMKKVQFSWLRGSKGSAWETRLEENIKVEKDRQTTDRMG